jgi:uncharacterized protein (TIGR01244 family)
MRHRVLTALILVLPLLLASAGAAQETQAGLPGIRNYTPVDSTVACAGAVTPEAVAALKQAGFVSIVNLRTAEEEGENLEAMRKAAVEAGLRYIHVPFSATDPQPEPVDRFLEIARDRSNEPMLINCASGGRASMLLAIKRVMIDGWSVETAMAEVPSRSQGARPAVREFTLEYLKGHGKQ